MANFCAYCGKPLPPNGICECQMERPAQRTGFAAFVRAFVHDPTAAVAQVAAERNAALGALVLLLYVGASMLSWLTASVGLHLYLDIGQTPVALPLLFGLIFALAVAALGTLAVFLSAKAARRQVSFRQALLAVSVGSLVPAVICAAGILLNLYFPLGVVWAAVFAFSTVLTDAVIALSVFDGHRTAAIALLGGFAVLALLLGVWLYYQGIFQPMVKGIYSAFRSWLY